MTHSLTRKIMPVPFMSIWVLTLSILFHIVSDLVAQERQIFDGVTLERALPSVFFPGEIYFLRGTIDDFQGRIRVACTLDHYDGKFNESHRFTAEQRSFEVKLHFKEKGAYYLNLKVGDGRWTDPVVVLATEPAEVLRRSVERISNFRLELSREKAQLKWSTKNELIQVRVSQGAEAWTVVLSNQPQSFDLTSVVSELLPDQELVFRIQGARSTDGSYYTLASEWSEWQALTIRPVRRLLDYVEPSVDFKVPFPLIGDPNVPKNLKLNIRKNFGSQAFIKRPDGRVETVRLKCGTGPERYKYLGIIFELCQPGSCEMTFTPDLPGLYIIEINDQESKALINLPFYCGDARPILPLKEGSSHAPIMDLEAGKQYMLTRINTARTKLGLRSLRLDSSLVPLSQYYADRMARENFYGHFAPDGENINHRSRKFAVKSAILENVGFALDVVQVQAALERSPSHYKTMIDSTVTRIGLGVARGKNGDVFVAQHFAPDTLTIADMEALLNSLMTEMKKENPNLKRIYSPGEQPSVGTMKYQALTPERLRKLVLVLDQTKFWNQAEVGRLFVERFDQTVDGLFLEITFYPHVVETESKKK